MIRHLTIKPRGPFYWDGQEPETPFERENNRLLAAPPPQPRRPGLREYDPTTPESIMLREAAARDAGRS